MAYGWVLCMICRFEERLVIAQLALPQVSSMQWVGDVSVGRWGEAISIDEVELRFTELLPTAPLDAVVFC